MVTYSAQLFFAGAVCAGLLAMVTLVGARRSLPRWSFAVGMLALGCESFLSGQSTNAKQADLFVYWQTLRLVAMAFIPGPWLLFALAYARGNAAKFLTKWRWVIILAFLLPIAICVGSHSALFAPVLQGDNGSWIFRLQPAGLGLYLLVLISSIMILMHLERTFRASMGTMRWRIKFMLLGLGVLFVVRVYTASQTLLFNGLDISLDGINTVALLVSLPLVLRSFFRRGNFNLDVYPSQSVLQNSLTVVLAGAYLVVVGVLAKLVHYLGSDSSFAPKAFLALVSLVLLAVLSQSDRLRLHLRRFVSRHFQRPLYDYRTTWKKFTDATTSQVEQADLCRSLVRLLAEMFQSLSVTLWLLDDKKETFVLAASTSLSGTGAEASGPQGTDFNRIIRHFQTHSEPVDIDSSKETWARALKQIHPAEFPNGGDRVCIPMIGRGELLGVIIMGDRVAGLAFSLQDFDMLKCVGDHAAASLLNVQLSRKLLQAKELEAFQTMATFFVHDLKNAASTLNLMLQNLPVHFDDPEFRADALRGTAKTVTHINNLIGRLSLLRHELKIQAAEADLNEEIGKAVADLEVGTDFRLVKDFGPVPRLRFDADQIGKVVINLVLNSRDALGGKGEVRITTSQSQGWAVVAVTDNGCGMTPDFLERSLFRPFQTTKKSGLGIGMFQSKTIVEAHGGRIAATSELGKGTTFQVFLPITFPSG